MGPVEGKGIGLFDGNQVCVGRLSHKGESLRQDRLPSIREIRVLALVHRDAGQNPEPSRRKRYNLSEWEVAIVEVGF